jgi:hypothetical protein
MLQIDRHIDLIIVHLQQRDGLVTVYVYGCNKYISKT